MMQNPNEAHGPGERTRAEDLSFTDVMSASVGTPLDAPFPETAESGRLTPEPGALLLSPTFFSLTESRS